MDKRSDKFSLMWGNHSDFEMMEPKHIMDRNYSTDLLKDAQFLPPVNNNPEQPLSPDFLLEYEYEAAGGDVMNGFDNGTFHGSAPSTQSSPSAATADPQLVMFQLALVHLDNYFVPLILLVGVAGNTLSFVVFVATHLKRRSCHIYLASLAVADNVFLVCVFISWGGEHSLGSISLYKQHGWCPALMFLTYVSSFLSVWYIVSFTLERWLITCHPLKQNRLYTTKMAKIVVISLALFSLVAYSYTIFTSGILQISSNSSSKVCAPLPQYYDVVSTINNIDTLITLIIPTFIIIGCNIRITYVVCSFYKTYSHIPRHSAVLQKWDFSHTTGTRKQHQHLRPDVSWNSHNNSAATMAKYRNQQPGPSSATPPINITRSSHMRATRMLLIVSTVFLVCNLPSHAARTYSFVMNIVDPMWHQPTVFILIQKLFQILNYINFSMNFFLYSLSGRSFRNGLQRLKVKIQKKVRSMTCLWCEESIANSSSPRMLSNKTDLHVPSYL